MQILVRLDNEYFQSGFGNAQYFAELEATYYNASIVVPLTYNDPGEKRNFVNGTVRSPQLLPCAIVFLTLHVLTGCRRYIWVRLILFCRTPKPS